MAAKVGNITRVLGKVERTFGLLSAEDLVELTAYCPNPNGEVMDLASLDRLTRHPTGCTRFLYAAAQKVNPLLKYEDVSKWGAIFTRTKVAKEIFDLSVLSGEEDMIPKAEGEGTAATTGSTPQSSLVDSPDSGTRGG